MFQILLLLFIAVPIVEIVVLLQVGDLLGGLNTLLLIVITAVVGAALVKQQGMRNWMIVQSKLAQGQVPGVEMAGGLLLFLAGILLITPGFVTDLLGLIFLFPPSRNAIAKSMLKRMVVGGGRAGFSQFHFRQGTANSGPRQGAQEKENGAEGNVIDGEYSYRRDPDQQIEDKAPLNPDDEREIN